MMPVVQHPIFMHLPALIVLREVQVEGCKLFRENGRLSNAQFHGQLPRQWVGLQNRQSEGAGILPQTFS